MGKYDSTVETKSEHFAYILKHAMQCHPSFPDGHPCRREGERQEKPHSEPCGLGRGRGRGGGGGREEWAGDVQTVSMTFISFIPSDLNKNKKMWLFVDSGSWEQGWDFSSMLFCVFRMF